MNNERRRRNGARKRYMERMKVLTPHSLKYRALSLAGMMAWQAGARGEASSYLEEARRIILTEYTLVDELPEPLPKPGPRPKKSRGRNDELAAHSHTSNTCNSYLRRELA
jgi:hypothetical protein